MTGEFVNVVPAPPAALAVGGAGLIVMIVLVALLVRFVHQWRRRHHG